MMFGSRYGKRLNRALLPKSHGMLCTGSAVVPPSAGPMMEPQDQTMGMIENAVAWYRLSVTSSAIIVRMMPTLPLSRPIANRATTA